MLTPNVTTPFKGDDVYLNGDCAFVNVYAGAEEGSIISANGDNLTITGQTIHYHLQILKGQFFKIMPSFQQERHLL